MNTKKAQSALEYLMTYGWAILIIVIVGGALYALNVFTPTTTKVCSGFGTLVYKDHSLDVNGTMTIAVTAPAISDTLTVTGMSLGGLSSQPVSATVTSSGVTTLSVQEPTLGKAAGTQYSGMTVTIAYTDESSGIPHSDSATCMGQYE